MGEGDAHQRIMNIISQYQDGDHRPRRQGVTAGNLRSLPPSTANSISAKFGLINARSAQNESTALSEYMLDKSVDLLAVTEAWLSVSSQSSVINSLCPERFAFLSISHGEKVDMEVMVCFIEPVSTSYSLPL